MRPEYRTELRSLPGSPSSAKASRRRLLVQTRVSSSARALASSTVLHRVRPRMDGQCNTRQDMVRCSHAGLSTDFKRRNSLRRDNFSSGVTPRGREKRGGICEIDGGERWTGRTKRKSSGKWRQLRWMAKVLQRKKGLSVTRRHVIESLSKCIDVEVVFNATANQVCRTVPGKKTHIAEYRRLLCR